jgi:hypothetical protein
LRRGGGEHIKIETETHRCIYNFYEIYLQSDMSTASESKKIEEKKNKKKIEKNRVKWNGNKSGRCSTDTLKKKT